MFQHEKRRRWEGDTIAAGKSISASDRQNVEKLSRFQTLSDRVGSHIAPDIDVDHAALTILRHLYSSEINYPIASFWDGGCTAQLGDELNGWLARKMGLESLQQVADWLKREAIQHHPDSKFTDKYRNHVSP